MVNQIDYSYHDNFGNIGVDKTVELIRRVYSFPKLRDRVKMYILNCLKCIPFSPLSGKNEGFLHNIPKFYNPFDTLHADY